MIIVVFKLFRASDKCQKEKRKTINGDDLLWAMATLGFEDYIDPLKVYLTRYREGDTKGSAKASDGSSRDAVPNPNSQLAHQRGKPKSLHKRTITPWFSLLMHAYLRQAIEYLISGLNSDL
nr:Nuclear transcription factor Y subunit B-8 [Ipomoea batatas]